jgi:hypothetical protein
VSRGKLLKGNGGGDRTRTCIAFRPAVFKTAALPLCDPSAFGSLNYNARVRTCSTLPPVPLTQSLVVIIL